MLKYGKTWEINQSITTFSVCVLSQTYPIHNEFHPNTLIKIESAITHLYCVLPYF